MTQKKRASTTRQISTIGAVLVLILASAAPAFADPAMKTIAQLAREEGWNPDQIDSVSGLSNLAKDIPRDFPVPASSHNLEASNAVAAASVTGTAEEAETFYREVFQLQGWHIDKQLKLPGYIAIVACKAGQCVNLSAASPGGVSGDPNEINFLFFKEKKSN